MRTYIVAFFLAMAVAASVTPLVCRLAHRFGWLDRPSEARKIHRVAIPRVGGLAVVLAFFAPIFGLAIYENRVSDLLYSDLRLVLGLFGGAAAIVALGIYDDIKGADARLKLAVQSATALGLWLVGFRIELLGTPLGEALPLGYWSLPLTMVWIVGVVNAVNLIDGLDGLASGVALLASIVLFGVAFVDGAALLCLITVALAGSLVGFLFWNFNPAKIFLGDSGSMFLGFVLASVSIWTHQKGPTAAALLIPVLALGLPILDTTLSVVRRVGRGRSPFEADREHLHHKLLESGLSHRSAVLTLYTASIVFGLAGLALLDSDTTHRAIALSTTAVVTVILVRRVALSPRPPVDITVDRGAIRRVVRAVRLADSREEAWSAMVPAFSLLGLTAVRLTWVRDRPDRGDRRASLFFWRSSPEVEWPLDRAEIHPSAYVVSLDHEGETLGELALVFDRPVGDVKRHPELRLAAELLGEALVEHRTVRDQFFGNVVPFGEALRAKTVQS